jgi:hypothetical protein
MVGGGALTAAMEDAVAAHACGGRRIGTRARDRGLI